MEYKGYYTVYHVEGKCGWKMGRWEDGKMGRWEDGKMGRWEDGKMGRWEDGLYD